MHLEIFTPDLGRPVTNSQEVFEMARVSFNVVDRAVMFSLFKTEPQVDFDLLSLVGLEDVTLLGTDQVLERGSIRVVLKRGTTENLRDGLVTDLEVFDELELFSGTGFEVSLIPPQKTAISGGRDAL